MAQLISITSEALQATIRRLLPSQQGFGEDLQASNVITPIIDLTPSAEGSEVRADLQTAINFGGNTAFQVDNTTTTIINTPGFWKIQGIVSIGAFDASNAINARINLSDSLSTKQIWRTSTVGAAASQNIVNAPIDLTVFLKTGEGVSIDCDLYAIACGSYRQVADVNGNLVNPVGFTPQ